MSAVTAGGRRIKVAIVIPRLTGGGAEFVACEWADYLRSAGHDVTVIITHGSPEVLARVPVVALTASSFASRAWELRRHVAAQDYDVLLGMMPHWNLLVLLATLGRSGSAPAVLISGRTVESPVRRAYGWSFRAQLALCHLLYRRADGYIAISHPVAAEAIGTYGLDPSRVWVVPNPATGKAPGSKPRPSRPVRRPGQPTTVTLTVPARLIWSKQPEVAVETAAVLRSHYGMEASVEYFGEGPREDLVREAAARLGIPVSFRGWVTSWFDESAADSVVLLPSVTEGFANVLVEAAAAGIPSVASSRALGVADAMIPNLTGILALDTAPDCLAEAVSRAVDLTPAAAGAWFDRFSPAESGARLLQVIRSVVRSSPRDAEGLTTEVSSADRFRPRM